MKKRATLAYPCVVWVLIFILVPMFLIAYHAFFVDGSFTVSNITEALQNEIYLKVFGRSVVIAIEATVICLLLGYPIAYMLSNMKKSTASLLYVLFIVPMWMNFLLRTYAWQVILGANGILNTFFEAIGIGAQDLLYTEGAVLLGTVYNFLPFMILPIYTVLIKLDKSHVEAAMDLGANGFKTFFKITLPLSMPGVISGITMVFIPAITTFAISRLLGGGKFMLFGELIENQFLSARDWSTGSALSFILLILVLISMAIMRHFDKDTSDDSKGGGGKLW